MARGARANDFVDGRARCVRASVPVDERVRVRAVELVDEAARPVRASALVDEISHDRHDFAPGSVVESPVRAAGGFPTLGGGLRVLRAIRRARPLSGVPVESSGAAV